MQVNLDQLGKLNLAREPGACMQQISQPFIFRLECLELLKTCLKHELLPTQLSQFQFKFIL